MAIHAELSDYERFLLTVPNDTEDAPWMVMSGLQVRDVDLLKAILRLHVKRQGLHWYLESFLKITMPRPGGEGTLEAAPDLLMAEGPDRLRTSWSILDEGKAPQFALEVTVQSSWHRDTEEKPAIYDAMGVRELAIFAPERRDGGPALFGYHRDDENRWAAWETDPAGVLWSRELGGLGLYVEDRLWLRAIDQQGRRLPTPMELAEAAEAEAAHLREELRRLRGEGT